ncbi:MAG TPA: FG-GAP-like repeat-containing protein [Chthonomonadaceae bacterium]|nr:FG-GAP-like repeat-containing protein [Chthonomonadaceae bacterium]
MSLSPSAATGSARRADAILEVTDWQQAQGAGWTFGDSRDGQHHGQVSVVGKVARMANDQESKTGWAEIAYPQPLAVPERFTLAVRMRLLKIGQDDDSTGQKTNLHLRLGVRSPSGDFGLGFQFIADRYKVDDQYKIFRTKDAWHDWLFEIDTRKKTVAMSRDGEYVCLHKGGAAQEPGLRFLAQGTAAVPALVEIAELRIAPLPPEAAPAPRPKPERAEPFAPGEWPMWRHDVRNSGASLLVGKMLQPRIAWQTPVGGVAVTPTLLDVDGDGRKEAIISYGGNFSVYRLDGSLLWQERADGVVHGAFDLDDDGETELLVASGSPSRLRVLRGRDGKTLYTCAQFPKAGVMAVRVAKLAPEKKGLQAVVWAPLHEKGYCLSFAEGAAHAKVDYLFDWQMTGFTPLVALADMDKDGLPEIVIGTYDRVLVIDGRTGQNKMRLETPLGRNYGTLVVKDIDGDGYPDVVLLADVLREHVAVVKNEGGKALRLLWDTFYEQNYPEDHKALRVLTDSVDDFDGDGKTEIAYSLFDDTADAKWHTLIVDAISGAIKSDIPGRYLIGAGALFPDSPPSLFLSAPSSRTALNLDRVAVWSGRGGAWQEQAKLPPGTLVSPGSALDFAPNTWAQMGGIGTAKPTAVLCARSRSDPQRGLFLARSDSKGRLKTVTFVTGNRAGQIEIAWQGKMPADLPAGTVLSVEETLPGAHGLQTLHSGADGVVRVIGADGKLLGSVQSRAGFVTAPVVARLRAHETPSILFMDARGDVCCVRPPREGGSPQKRWSHPSLSSPDIPVIPQLRPLGCPCVPVVAALNGNGEREILIAREPDRLVALNADGEPGRSWKLPSLPVAWNYGDLDGDDALDLFVTYKLGQWVDVESVALAGKDGRPLWRAHCGNGPAAICDLDGNGLDDVTLRDLFEHRTLNGRTGRDLYPITQWAGYHTPAIVPLEGKGKPDSVVWTGGNYSLVVEDLAGRQRWWKPFIATGLEAIADVDGDGRMEIGGVTAGQLYHWPEFYPVDGPDKEFLCYDALTGEVKWTYPLGVTASAVVSADVDGDGKPEFVFGTRDGRLIALRGGAESSRRKLWELTFPAALGMPVVCDADGDAQMEILVSCADGNLYCVK